MSARNGALPDSCERLSPSKIRMTLTIPRASLSEAPWEGGRCAVGPAFSIRSTGLRASPVDDRISAQLDDGNIASGNRIRYVSNREIDKGRTLHLFLTFEDAQTLHRIGAQRGGSPVFWGLVSCYPSFTTVPRPAHGMVRGGTG
jgi:hypothetical protein